MRRVGARGAVIVAMLALLVVPSVASAQSGAPHSQNDGGGLIKLPLSHAGRWITDAQGHVVVLHGTNMVYKLAPYYPQAIGFGPSDAAFLKRIGFDAVRVGVLWQAVEPQPGVYDDAYLRHIAQTVAMLGRYGIVSLLDFHQDQYNQLFQGEGFPSWAVQDDGLPAEPQLGFGGDYIGMPALERAFDHFWDNSPGPGGVGLQDRYAAAWAHVALFFAGNRNVLGYELMNEPWPGSIWPTCAQTDGCPTFDTGPFASFYRLVIGAIRRVDPRTLIWYEPQVLFNYGSTTNLPALGDSRLGFAFHDYCLQNDEGAGTQTCQTFDQTVFANALGRVAKTGDALLETEFGATQDSAILQPNVQRADQDMVSWLEWAFCGCDDPTTSGPGAEQAIVIDPSKPATGSNLVLPTLRVLVEPYPQLISGTPLSWGFDASAKTFSFKYSTARASGRGRFGRGSLTAIATPPFVYAGRYGVHASGAAIVSRRGAGVLVLAACRGASTIAVTVSPRGPSQGSCRPAARAKPRRGSR
jgi:endoglycosylceramidase